MPINPPAPTPPIKQRAVARAKYEAHRHTRSIEVALLGLALGVLVAITVSPVLGLAVTLVYAIGGAVTALAMQGGK